MQNKRLFFYGILFETCEAHCGEIMQIELTTEQYRLLLKLAHLGDYMANAYSVEEENDESEKLLHHLHSYAPAFKEKEFIHDKPFENVFRSTESFDNMITEMISEYNDEVFWIELCERLAARDLEEKYSKKELESMDVERLYRERQECMIPYENEFEKNGIDRLTIK